MCVRVYVDRFSVKLTTVARMCKEQVTFTSWFFFFLQVLLARVYGKMRRGNLDLHVALISQTNTQV